MPSKKSKTSLSKKKTVKVTAKKTAKSAKGTTSKKVEAGGKKSDHLIVKSSSRQAKKPPSSRLQAKTKHKLVGTSPAKQVVVKNNKQASAGKVQSLSMDSLEQKKDGAALEQKRAEGKKIAMASSASAGEGSQAKGLKKSQAYEKVWVTPTSAEREERPESSKKMSTVVKNTLSKKDRLEEEDKKGYSQGALFMDEYETFQDEQQQIDLEKNGRSRYSPRSPERLSETSLATKVKAGKGKNSEWSKGQASGELNDGRKSSTNTAVGESANANKTEGKLGQLQIKVSNSLHRKLMSKAEMEGVSVDDFVSELLAEGLVLRAWEIMERKNAMRSNHQGNNFQANNRQQNRYGFRSPGQSNNNNYGRGRVGHGNGGNQGNGNNSNSGNSGNNGNLSPAGQNNRRMNYNQIMEDSANFLEYVRNQEKKQR